MTRILKQLICLGLGIGLAGHVSAFSLWGPAETWQTQDLDYGIRYLSMLPMPDFTVAQGQGLGSLFALNFELGGTKNISEGSRLNVPIITYGFDYTFLAYFGQQGVAAVDSAFNVLNGLPKASDAELSSFLTEDNQQVNYSAQAMRMLDLKSTVLWLMMEHMGLIGETHTFDLRERIAPGTSGAAACDFDYVVLPRNFDPMNYNPTNYVNGTLLTYQIGDLCPTVQVGDAMEEAVQAGFSQFSSVATRETLQLGGYYLRITRDDMGGLKYLYPHNRYVNEGFDTNELLGAISAAQAAAAAAAGQGGYNPVSFVVTNGVTNVVTNLLATNAVTNVGGVYIALVGGVEKITFVKTPYDSQLGTYFAPITYHYTMPWVSNYVIRTLNVTRTVTAPDIIFTAGDLTFPGPDPYQETLARTSPGANFITYGDAVSPGAVNTQATITTPSVITPELVITLNNTGQVYYNVGTEFTDQANAPDIGFIWGTFNGSTNAPIAYPTGASIGEIQNEVLSAGPETMQVGVNGVTVTSNSVPVGYNPISFVTTNVSTAQ
jgi:hypothetical protein